MSAPSTQRSPQGVSLLSLPEELLERILGDCMESVLWIPNSTFATSPYPSSTGSPAITPSNSQKSSSTLSNPPRRSPSRPPTRSEPSALPQASSKPASPVTLLLVSHLFHRISIPLLYRSITLSSRSRAQKLLEGSLRHYHKRVGWIRRLVVAGVWAEAGELLRLVATAGSGSVRAAGSPSGFEVPQVVAGVLKGKGREFDDDESSEKGRAVVGLEALEITIDMANLPRDHPVALAGGATADPSHVGNSPSQDTDTQGFCEGLAALAQAGATSSLKELVLRKPQNAYMTHGRPKAVLAALARVVESAPALRTAYIAFRLTDDPIPRSHVPSEAAKRHQNEYGPIAALTHALSLCPRLHSIATHLPSVWNEALLRMSQNPTLERIVLLDVAGRPVTFNKESDPGPPFAGACPTASLSRGLPPHPLDRVYTTSARGCDGYAISGSNRRPGLGMPAVPGTGIFMNKAQKHERLCTLVHAGYLDETNKALLASSTTHSLPSHFTNDRSCAAYRASSLPSSPSSENPHYQHALSRSLAAFS